MFNAMKKNCIFCHRPGCRRNGRLLWKFEQEGCRRALPPLPLPKLRLAQTAPRSAIRRLHAAPRKAGFDQGLLREKSCCEKRRGKQVVAG